MVTDTAGMIVAGVNLLMRFPLSGFGISDTGCFTGKQAAAGLFGFAETSRAIPRH
jgi:hypothetical protein